MDIIKISLTLQAQESMRKHSHRIFKHYLRQQAGLAQEKNPNIVEY